MIALIQTIKKISLEVYKPNLFKVIAAKQGDSNSRFLKATIVDDARKIFIPLTSTATINAVRSDGESKSFEGMVNEDGTVTVPLTSWMLQYDGVVECDVSVFGAENSKLTTSKFIVEVEDATCTDGDISEDENYDILVQLIADVRELQKNGGGGGNGEPGYSPTVEIAKTENGHKINITDVNGTKEFEVLNGKDGYTPQKGIDYFDGEKGDKGDSFTYEDFTAEQLEALKGKDGADGKTPEKGVDYFTDEDKEEIINAATENIPAGVFIIDAVADFANNCLTDVSHSFDEIKAAYERNEHIVINVNIEQLFPNGNATVPLVMIDNEKAAFSTVVYIDSAVNFYASIRSDRTYLSINPLVGQEQIDAINASLDNINGVVI